MRHRTPTIAVLTTAALLTLGATPVSAAYIPTGTAPHILAVNDTADLNRAGTAARWKVKITCPKGERYTVRALLAQYPTAALRETVTGTCTGRAKGLTLTLDGTVALNLAAPLTDAFADLATPSTEERGNPRYCYSVDTECEDATQVGPNIRLT